MNQRGWTKVALAVALGAGVFAPRGWADEVGERDLVGEEKTLDREASRSGDGSQAAALSRQFGLPESRIQELRGSGKGWGALSIELALARELTKTNPELYPTLELGLTKVSALRAEGKGYGSIAKDLGFKLGPVVSAARHVRSELRRDARAPRPEPVGRPDKPAKPEGVQKPERPARPERAARPGKPN